MLCPVCEQDDLSRVRVDSRPGLLCPECDSLWFEGVTPSFDRFDQLEDYLESQGLDLAVVLRLDNA